MKLFVFIVFCIFSVISPPELSQLRKDYIAASGDKNLIDILAKSLTDVTTNDKPEFIAYKGALLAMQSKYAKGKERKELFKKGASLLEAAVVANPNNIEIRVIRLSIQENVPKLLKYNANISEDKEFILKNYRQTPSKGLKSFVKGYVLQSEGFTVSEKESLL